ncbi:unnamed protein product [marine sediment metagenome]|uniref:Uncharacterized protein n=1 Tax=marine sediment metagenome TaxID=412755 RepID=X1IFD2_9ZZZZ
MINERLESALAWCKKNNLESIRLKKFNRESKKKLFKGNLGKKEFKEMCKKAGVKKSSLCKTIFTENL